MKYMYLLITILVPSGLAWATIKQESAQVPITPYDTMPLAQLEGSSNDPHEPYMPFLPYVKDRVAESLGDPNQQPWLPYPYRLLAEEFLLDLTDEEWLKIIRELREESKEQQEGENDILAEQFLLDPPDEEWLKIIRELREESAEQQEGENGRDNEISQKEGEKAVIKISRFMGGGGAINHIRPAGHHVVVVEEE